MGLWPVIGPLAPVMISTVGRGGLGIELAALSQATASATSTANRAILIPIYIPSDTVVSKLMFEAISSTGNVDMGVYDDAFTLVVSKGSTAIATPNALNELDITDTPLDRGAYYLVIAFSNGGANQFRGIPALTISGGKFVGMLMQDTAFPLPATITPVVVATSAVVPLMGVSGRALVA